MDITHRIAFPSVGRCIYCGSSANLSEEHIIPHSINGYYVLPEASCPACAAHINRFEQRITGETFLPLRVGLGLRSRKNKKREHLKAFINDNGHIETTIVHHEEYPRYYAGLHIPTPGIMRKVAPTPELAFVLHVRQLKSENKKMQRKFGLSTKRAFKLFRMDPSAFLLLLAKIAHGFAVAHFGIDSFQHRLAPLLLDKPTTDTLPYLIGCDTEPIEKTHHLHIVNFAEVEIEGIKYRAVTIQLFALLGYPRYIVIAGEDLTK